MGLSWYRREGSLLFRYNGEEIASLSTAGVFTATGIVIGTTTVEAGAIVLADDEAVTLGTSSDMLIEWDTAGTDSLRFLPAADDTIVSFGISAATQLSCDIIAYGQAANGADLLHWDASASELLLEGDARLNFSSATILAANTDGGIIKAGTALAPVTQDTADMKFVSLYFDDGATSGDARGIYNRLYITGAAGGGESLRSYTDVVDVAGASAHGAHISLGFGTSGYLTGLGVAARATLHMPSTALAAGPGTYAAVQAEIYSDATTSDPGGHIVSAFRVVNAGSGGGPADVDDDGFLMDIVGWTAGSGNMVGGNTAGAGTLTFTNWKTLRILIDGVAHYIPCAQTVAATG